MKEYADLISATAALLWPIFAFFVLFLFKKQIAGLLERLKKGKVFGQEIELSDSLSKLDESAAVVAKEVAAIPTTEPPSEKLEATAEIKDILREAARSPKAALLLLASDLEREARQMLASVGHLEGRRHIPLSHAIAVLDKQFGGLPGHIPSSLKLFWDARNKLIHGGEASDEDILRAIDSGITILKALRAFPREVNIVYHPGIDVFSDPQCQNKIEGVKGIILETESPGGTTKSFRIFPSTQQHFTRASGLHGNGASRNRGVMHGINIHVLKKSNLLGRQPPSLSDGIWTRSDAQPIIPQNLVRKVVQDPLILNVELQLRRKMKPIFIRCPKSNCWIRPICCGDKPCVLQSSVPVLPVFMLPRRCSNAPM